MDRYIYKICTPDEWAAAEKSGVYTGSGDDRRDGFIHFSRACQLAGTAKKHFAGQSGLVVVTVDGSALGPALRWEASRSGQLFPHLYGDLPVSAAHRVSELEGFEPE